jgi:ribose/xylose/arabinose/galactoside ABC-type transport system permease subunit
MDLPKIFITLGIGLIFVGVVLKFGARAPWLFSWFGNLPGDIKYQGERTFFYAPIVSMLLVSIVVSLIVAFVQRLGR